MRKQQKKTKEMLAQLKKGDRVVTSGGIYGTVAQVEDQVVWVKIADTVKVKMAKSAITSRRRGRRDAEGTPPPDGATRPSTGRSDGYGRTLDRPPADVGLARRLAADRARAGLARRAPGRAPRRGRRRARARRPGGARSRRRRPARAGRPLGRRERAARRRSTAFSRRSPRSRRVPVFVAPGNHDFAGPGGFYDPSVLAALGMRSWPENVVVFREPSWTVAPFPGRPDVAVVGRAFLSRRRGGGRGRSRRRRPGPRSRSRCSSSTARSRATRAPDAPTRREEDGALLAATSSLDAGFSWAALGHHHHLAGRRDDADGRAAGAYAGCPTGRGLDETGPRVFLKVTLARRRAGRGRDASRRRAARSTTSTLDAADLDAPALRREADAALRGARGSQPAGRRPR